MSYQPSLPWWKRLAHKQRDISRAIRGRRSNETGGFIVSNGQGTVELNAVMKGAPAAREDMNARQDFMQSAKFKDLVAKAQGLDPNVQFPRQMTRTYLAPWHDRAYFQFRDAITALPEGPFDAVILMPFGKLGGADYVAGVLAGALREKARVLILRTDAADWERPDWFPDDVPSVDLSGYLAGLHDAPRALYTILQTLDPSAIYNVNSRLGFDCLKAFGARLARDYDLFSYFFCADRTPDGVETGYPVWYAADVMPHLTATLVDSRQLEQSLTQRYAIPAVHAKRIRTLYTPASTRNSTPPLAMQQIASRAERDRPRLLWAGRLDLQKRFDLLVAIARAMPEVDFEAWGKAVLDKPPKAGKLPSNLTLHPPYSQMDELPLAASDGWIYTSAWDGLPTILIELAARGMPIVASAVGGVPELIQEHTGWPVVEWDDPGAYVTAINAMLSDPDARAARASALQELISSQHDKTTYQQTLCDIAKL